MDKPIKKLITHDGSFHTDDIFAAATLILYLEKTNNDFSAQGGPASGWEIIRTRDQDIINDGDYVFDVGGIYDAEKNRFDHHQIGGAGKRENAIEYASFGLVWKKFGLELCKSPKAFEIIDKKLVLPIDAWDNGFDLVTNKYSEISPYFIQHIFSGMEPTWREENLNINEVFAKCANIAKAVLEREIIQVQDALLAAESIVSIYKDTADRRIIVLDRDYPFQYTLHDFPEPLFVIYPRKNNNLWGVKAVREDPKTFKNRKDFPASWAGLRDEELVKAAGVSDAVFCHRGLFMAVAKSKEGAIKLAQIAVES